MQNVIIMTNGQWTGTNIVNPDFPTGENGISAAKVHVRLKVVRDFMDAITEIQTDAYGVLTDTPTERLPLFPGTFEVSIGSKSLSVQNINSLYDPDMESTLPDPDGWIVTSQSLDTFDDPVQDYLTRVGYYEENLFEILDELLVIFDVEGDLMRVELSLFQGRTFRPDLITKITLLAN